MQKRFALVLAIALLAGLSSFAQAADSAMKKKAAPAGPAPDKAWLQKVLDGWSTLDPADAAKFYAPGPGLFFDVSPLKYNSWEEYQEGVKKILANYQSIKFTEGDDAIVRVHGDFAWAALTIKEDAVLKSGKHEMATLRWTVIFEKQNGKWLIVHDHTSEPLQ